MAPSPHPSPAAAAPESQAPPPATLALLAGILLVAGLVLAADGPFAFSAERVIAAVAGQLGTTLPAALLIAAAAALNLAAGAVVVRAILGRPLEGLGQTIVGAYLGAVLLDLSLLVALGGTGLFRWPILVLLHVALLAAGTRLRPIALGLRPEPGGWTPVWLVVGLGWTGLLLLQLASPVVPFVDVLPNHVAPVERLRTFGDFSTLTTTASPIYGPSRTFLGYVALLGTVDTLTMLPATLGVAAFALPGAVAVAAGLQRLGTAVGGGRTGTWAVVAFILTTSFVRLPDARATVLVLPLGAWALAELADCWSGRRVATLRDSLLVGGAIAAAILFHPVIGSLVALTVVLVTLAGPRAVQDLGVPALAAGAVLALPQLATMVELPLPMVVAFAVVPIAVGTAWLLQRSQVLRRVLVLGGRAAGGLTILGALITAPVVLPALRDGLDRILPTMPVLLATVLAGALIAPRRLATPVLLGMLAAGAIAATATELAPPQGTLLTALRFEVPKTLHYWLPIGVALAAAVGLDTLWGDRRLRGTALPGDGALPRLALAAFLAAAILPFRAEPLTDAYHLGERRLSETVALQLRWAEAGYWSGYPDPRRLIAADGAELIDALRVEIADGRLGPASEVLHVAASFQQWAAVPLGVFAGVIETDVTPDAEVSIHTVGGRLHRLEELPAMLQRAMPYVVLEPNGLPPGTREAIVGAGYRTIFANSRGELLRLGSPS